MERKDPSLLQSGPVCDMTARNSAGLTREYWDLAQLPDALNCPLSAQERGPEGWEVVGHWKPEKTVLKLSLCVPGQRQLSNDLATLKETKEN